MMPLPLPKPEFRAPKPLQALLLLGGAFAFAGAGWFFASHRPIQDPDPILGERAVAAMTFVGQPRFLAPFETSLPPKAAAVLRALSYPKGSQTTLFAYRQDDGSFGWGAVVERGRVPAQAEAISLSAGSRSPLLAFDPEQNGAALAAIIRNASPSSRDPKAIRRWVPRSADATGFVEIGGRRQPFLGFFLENQVIFKIGRTYRGLDLKNSLPKTPPHIGAPIHDQIAQLEKPPGISWNGLPGIFKNDFQRFQALSDPWSWPGQLGLTVSGSATGEGLMPFVLSYRAQPGETSNVSKKIDEFAKKILSETVPEAVIVNLPDHTHLTELRQSPDAVQVQTRQNRFGNLLKFTVPGNDTSMIVFHALTGESYVSNAIPLIQAEILNGIAPPTNASSCGKTLDEGYASLNGSLARFGIFKKIDFTFKNLETGLFTICGYYR